MGSVKDYFSSLTTGFISLVKGMAVTGKEFVTPKLTEEYPDNRKEGVAADRFRAALTLKYDEEGRHKCIACGICQRNCPNGSIEIVKRVVTTPDGKKKQKLDRYVYNIGSCTFCRLCVTSCPQDALEFSNDFEQAVFTRDKLFKQLNYLPEKDEPMPEPKPAVEVAAKPAPQVEAPAADKPDVVAEIRQNFEKIDKINAARKPGLPDAVAAKIQEKVDALQQKIDQIVAAASADERKAIAAEWPQLVPAAAPAEAAPEAPAESEIVAEIGENAAKLAKLQKADLSTLPAPAAAKLKEKVDALKVKINELMAKASADELAQIKAKFPDIAPEAENKN
ncbi:MAG: NADH-quinone oxidoreductase subunit I [Muribaculaceae bacterium]|nr:NADH-quinone oxidoreductase subunit I [Muribaculaceae bacterium]